MSCRHNRLSNPIDAFISFIRRSGCSVNLPPRILSDMVDPVLNRLRALKKRATRLALTGVLYALACAGAISAAAGNIDPDSIRQIRQDDLKRLIVHDEPVTVTGTPFADETGGEVAIGDFAGSILVVNFWATWCPPCLKEMPSLDRLQMAFDPAELRVMAVATGRNPKSKVDKFISENEITALSVYYDEKARLSGKMSIISIPVTVIIDRNGLEIARFIGDTEWDSPAAIEMMEFLVRQ